jgi:hypothetical protein
MTRMRIAFAAAAALGALATASVASAFNTGPPKPFASGGGPTVVCHDYPGATAFNPVGSFGTPWVRGQFCFGG